MLSSLVYSWIIIQVLGLFILFAVGFLGFKVVQIFQLLSTIGIARKEFHENLVELSAIQAFDETVRDVQSHI
uniref:ATP synthase F0 subunit 8 n=1 Tax=Panagrolaimus sp. ES5 TaxID=591445 RepID=A0AC34F1H6_9BILA